ncbi:MAG TPA: carbamoyltransferase C-terminal domain-containing protein [Candidatus Acidoferrales bacterium]|jgi:carbamoyltransferase|nr:carbamoyltransferase C-terminal domain-containing protein [Candidatus Acidoferrales bacterium]
MVILGINAYHANAAAAIVVDGRLVAAVEEERLNRVKYAAGLPARAIQFCLDRAGVKLTEVDHIAVPRDPWARLGTKLRFAIRMPKFALDRVRVMKRFAGIREDLAAAFQVAPDVIRGQFHRIEHHTAHLASAFFVSPFDRAAVLSADGLGDFASSMSAVGEGPKMRVLGEVAFPHSLGMYYTALTQYVGFWKFGDEYKVMGLAAYGQPEFLEEFRRIVWSDGPLSFRLGLEYFTHQSQGAEMTWRDATSTPVLGRLFSEYLEQRLGPARKADEPLTQRHYNLASSMQAALEEVLSAYWNGLAKASGQKALCLAGGVAFNCVANGRIFDASPFENVYVQPAAGDAGLSVGAAFAVEHQILGRPRQFVMEHAYWGPQFSPAEIRSVVDRVGSADEVEIAQLDEDALLRATARHIAGGKILGWFQGGAEWGPRALGNRSILADPRRPEMKDILNKRIKHRESFRPFAPSIAEEATGEFFEKTHPSPFMTFAYPVRQEKRSVIPAPTHVDGTARLQTVSRTSNPLYWKLLNEVGRLTGVPVVLNTSFNDNEPIVCRPEEALECFRRTRMDVLVLGNFILERKYASGDREEPAGRFAERDT